MELRLITVFYIVPDFKKGEMGYLKENGLTGRYVELFDWRLRYFLEKSCELVKKNDKYNLE